MTTQTKKCLVTGGAGFIGSHLVEALVKQGYAVRVLDNLTTGHLENLAAVRDHIEFIEGDIQHETAVKSAVEGVDFIFHLAALVSVPESMAYPLKAELINGLGTLNLLQAARQAGVKRVVLSSTCAVYGDEPTLPKRETMPPCPKSPYAISKLTAEQYCLLFNEMFGLEAVVLRYFNVFGPRQDPTSPYSGVISIFVDKLRQNIAPTIFGNGTQTRDFVFVTDVVQANLLAAQTAQAKGRIFNIGTGQAVSVNQLFENLAHILNSPLKAQYQPERAGDIEHSWADPALAQHGLGWYPQMTLADGLRQTV